MLIKSPTTVQKKESRNCVSPKHFQDNVKGSDQLGIYDR